MAKFIAHSPNGQAYQCDSLAEVKQVEGGFKFRKAKKRNGGCGCAGACGNPHCGPKKRRNPRFLTSAQLTEAVNLYHLARTALAGPGKSPTKHDRMVWAAGEMHKLYPSIKSTAAYKDLSDALEWQNPGKRRNPTKTGIEYSWERIERLDPRVALQEARNALTTLSQSRRQGEAMRDFLKRDTYARERFNAALAYLQRRGVVSKFEAERYMSRNPDPRYVPAVLNPSSGAKQRARKVRSYGKGLYTEPDLSGRHARQLAKAAKVRQQAKKLGPTYTKLMHKLALDEAARVRNPGKQSHLAHEKEEEKIFASMLSRLPIGKTVQAGSHRVRKLSKGYAVIDGERLSMKDAAAKLHGR